MPPTGWANMLVPLFYCYRTSEGPYMQHDQGMISSYYSAVIPRMFPPTNRI